jgi:hypothetical protein
MLQLISWDEDPSVACDINGVPMDERLDKVGLGRTSWPTQAFENPRSATWRAYGAHLEGVGGEKLPQATCISLHKRYGARPAGPAIFAARLDTSKTGVVVTRLDAAPGQPKLAASMVFHNKLSAEPSIRVDWTVSGNETRTTKGDTAQLTAPGWYQISVVVAEAGAEYQIPAALEQARDLSINEVVIAAPRKRPW